MQVGQAKFGMQTMNQGLLSLYERHLITLEDAFERSLNSDELRQMLSTSNFSSISSETLAYLVGCSLFSARS
jgi:Tfp pilus assembly ATPase PilU